MASLYARIVTCTLTLVYAMYTRRTTAVQAYTHARDMRSSRSVHAYRQGGTLGCTPCMGWARPPHCAGVPHSHTSHLIPSACPLAPRGRTAPTRPTCSRTPHVPRPRPTPTRSKRSLAAREERAWHLTDPVQRPRVQPIPRSWLGQATQALARDERSHDVSYEMIDSRWRAQ